MTHIALEGNTYRSGLDTLADDCLHGSDLVIRGVTLLGSLTHYVAAHGGMSDERGDVNSQPPVQRVEVLRDRLPRPRDAGADSFQRDRFHMGQDARQHFSVFFMGRSYSQRTVADDNRGSAVIAGEGTKRIPGNLSIVVRV